MLSGNSRTSSRVEPTQWIGFLLFCVFIMYKILYTLFFLQGKVIKLTKFDGLIIVFGAKDVSPLQPFLQISQRTHAVCPYHHRPGGAALCGNRGCQPTACPTLISNSRPLWERDSRKLRQALSAERGEAVDFG